MPAPCVTIADPELIARLALGCVRFGSAINAERVGGDKILASQQTE